MTSKHEAGHVIHLRPALSPSPVSADGTPASPLSGRLPHLLRQLLVRQQPVADALAAQHQPPRFHLQFRLHPEQRALREPLLGGELQTSSRVRGAARRKSSITSRAVSRSNSEPPGFFTARSSSAVQALVPDQATVRALASCPSMRKAGLGCGGARLFFTWASTRWP